MTTRKKQGADGARGASPAPGSQRPPVRRGAASVAGQGGGAGEASPPEELTRDGRPVRRPDRDAILTATLDVVASLGFAATKVEDIIATAGIGRRKFWSYFPDKTAALAAAYVAVTAEVRAAVRRAHDDAPDPPRRIAACLAAVAEFLAVDPARAEVFLIQAPCAGRPVTDVRAETMRGFAALLADAIAEVRAGPLTACGSRLRSEPTVRSPIVIESLAGGLYEVAYVRTFRGEVRDLPALVPDLARLVLTPYLGPEAAQAAIAA